MRYLYLHGVANGCCTESRDGIHESTISFMFLSIILRFLRLDISIFVLPFYKNDVYEQTRVFLLVDCFI
jgi:hypothetical protein